MKESRMEKVCRITELGKQEIMNTYYNVATCSEFIEKLDGDNMYSPKITSTLRALYRELN